MDWWFIIINASLLVVIIVAHRFETRALKRTIFWNAKKIGSLRSTIRSQQAIIAALRRGKSAK